LIDILIILQHIINNRKIVLKNLNFFFIQRHHQKEEKKGVKLNTKSNRKVITVKNLHLLVVYVEYSMADDVGLAERVVVVHEEVEHAGHVA